MKSYEGLAVIFIHRPSLKAPNVRDDQTHFRVKYYGQLKLEPGARAEFDSLVASTRKRLADARNETLSSESRFDLAYNVAHAFALAASRWNGYRPENRYVAFQVLQHTLGLDAKIWRVLAKCHNQRNLAEYEGHSEVDEQLLTDLIRCTTHLEAAVATLDPPAKA